MALAPIIAGGEAPERGDFICAVHGSNQRVHRTSAKPSPLACACASAMPSDQSTWLVSIPQDGDSEGTVQELHTKLGAPSKASAHLAQLPIPSFKVISSGTRYGGDNPHAL